MLKRKFPKFIYLLACFVLIFQQSGFAQIATELNIAARLASLHNSFSIDKFRPLHLRYLQYLPQENNFKLLLDKGDEFLNEGGWTKDDGRKSENIVPHPSSIVPRNDTKLKEASQKLMQYFYIGLTLPNSSFWVNLRPDAEDNIIDEYLSKTDIGRVMLETDLQLKKDTASFTSPQTPEGREYWDKLYKKAEELYGNENITIPTLTRPWIVPGEIIIRETKDEGRGTAPSAYIYKATLKVMLESDYLKASNDQRLTTNDYTFKDSRSQALNDYSTQLIRQLIIPKLTKAVNSSKRYASLRQVYYSLILAQWFKARQGLSPHIAAQAQAKGTVPELINSRNLTNLISQEPWFKTTYFNAYKQSFAQGEYNIQEPVYTPTGQVIRSYFSGGENFNNPQMTIIPVNTSSPLLSQKFQIGKTFLIPLVLSASLLFNGDRINNKYLEKIGIEEINNLQERGEGRMNLEVISKIVQIIKNKQYSDSLRIGQIKFLGESLQGTRFIWSRNGPPDTPVDIYLVETKEVVLKTLIDLADSEDMLIKKGAIKALQNYANSVVLALRRAHLEQRIPSAELKKRLDQLTFKNAYLQYICYTSPENFGDLAEMILQELLMQAQELRKKTADNSKNTLAFLKRLDPKSNFYVDFILQSANFSHLKQLFSSPKSLTDILNSIFKDLSENDILKQSVRLALFFESVVKDKEFSYQYEFQQNFRKLYYSTSGKNKLMVAALLSVYKDNLLFLDQKEISQISAKENIKEYSDKVPYAKIFKDGRLVVHIVFVDNDAVSGHFMATLRFFLGKDPRYPKISGYTIVNSQKNRVKLTNGNIDIVLIKADKEGYDIDKGLGEANMIEFRNHAGHTRRALKMDKVREASGIIFFLSSCRSATTISGFKGAYKGAEFIGTNDTTYGDQTNIATFYMLDDLAKRVPGWRKIKQDISEHLLKVSKNYVFPGDQSMQVQFIVGVPKEKLSTFEMEELIDRALQDFREMSTPMGIINSASSSITNNIDSLNEDSAKVESLVTLPVENKEVSAAGSRPSSSPLNVKGVPSVAEGPLAQQLAVSPEVDKSKNNYFLLSMKEKEAFRVKVWSNLETKGYVLSISHALQNIKIAAERLMSSVNQNDTVVSFGQSPAWIVKTMQIMDSNPDRFVYLAFSGGWYEKVYPVSSLEQSSFKKISAGPNSDQKDAYKRYLRDLRLDPESITARKGKTVIVEYKIQGNSLKSFLSFLSEWAEELNKDIRGKVELRLFTEDKNGNIMFNSDESAFGFPLEYLEASTSLIRGLSESDEYNDRLVENYPYDKWAEIKPEEFIISENARLINFFILEYLDKYYPNLIKTADLIVSPTSSPLAQLSTDSKMIHIGGVDIQLETNLGRAEWFVENGKGKFVLRRDSHYDGIGRLEYYIRAARITSAGEEAVGWSRFSISGKAAYLGSEDNSVDLFVLPEYRGREANLGLIIFAASLSYARELGCEILRVEDDVSTIYGVYKLVAGAKAENIEEINIDTSGIKTNVEPVFVLDNKTENGELIYLNVLKKLHVLSASSTVRQAVIPLRPFNSVKRVESILPPSAQTVTLGMGEYSIVGPDIPSLRYLNTSNLRSCICVTLWDLRNKKGALAHINQGVDIDRSLNEIFTRLVSGGVVLKNLKANVVGGEDPVSKARLLRVFNILEQKDIPVNYVDILKPYPQSVVLDVYSGEIYELGDGYPDISGFRFYRLNTNKLLSFVKPVSDEEVISIVQIVSHRYKIAVSASSAVEKEKNSTSSLANNLIKWMAHELYVRLKRKGVNLFGTVLDVGCRDGSYIETLRNLGGKEIYGIDPDKNALNEAVNSGVLNEEHVISSKLEEWNHKAESIDSIVALNFIIPFKERGYFLIKALELLKIGGTLLISCAEDFTYQDTRKRLLSSNIEIIGEGVLFREHSGDFPNKYYLYARKIERKPAMDNIINSVGSPVIFEADREVGGIDFRALPIVTQAMSNLRLSASSAIFLNSLKNINLDREWQDIEKLVGAGITPSAERIKEYVQAASLTGNSDMQKVVSCITDILRLEEEECCPTEAMLKDILVVLESGRSSQELREIFGGNGNGNEARIGKG